MGSCGVLAFVVGCGMVASRIVFLSGFLLVSGVGCGGQEAAAPPPREPSSQGSEPLAARAASSPVMENVAAEPEPETQKARDTEPPKAAAQETTEDAEIPGANLRVGQLEADGLLTKNIVCKSEGGGAMALLGVVLVTAWMAPQKAALDACAPKGTETRVTWNAKDGKVTRLSAKGDAKTKACVEKALSSGKPVLEGLCAATLVHGKK